MKKVILTAAMVIAAFTGAYAQKNAEKYNINEARLVEVNNAIVITENKARNFNGDNSSLVFKFSYMADNEMNTMVFTAYEKIECEDKYFLLGSSDSKTVNIICIYKNMENICIPVSSTSKVSARISGDKKVLTDGIENLSDGYINKLIAQK